MGVLVEQTQKAVSDIDYALTILEQYPGDILHEDRNKLPDLYSRLARLVYRDWSNQN